MLAIFRARMDANCARQLTVPFLLNKGRAQTPERALRRANVAMNSHHLRVAGLLSRPRDFLPSYYSLTYQLWFQSLAVLPRLLNSSYASRSSLRIVARLTKCFWALLAL